MEMINDMNSCQYPLIFTSSAALHASLFHWKTSLGKTVSDSEFLQINTLEHFTSINMEIYSRLVHFC